MLLGTGVTPLIFGAAVLSLISGIRYNQANLDRYLERHYKNKFLDKGNENEDLTPIPRNANTEELDAIFEIEPPALPNRQGDAKRASTTNSDDRLASPLAPKLTAAKQPSVLPNNPEAGTMQAFWGKIDTKRKDASKEDQTPSQLSSTGQQPGT
jgi:hypothetical protein